MGVPTVADRVAQMVVKQVFEPKVESHFRPDSYGYRPGRSALDAVGVTRKRCWRYDWVLEFDIKGLFDNIEHELLVKAVRKHAQSSWEVLYIERWLKAPMSMGDGSLVQRTRGTPQGGVISPVLANLFLHYAFDLWMERTHPGVPWCRYADDGLVHCRTEQEAQTIHAALVERLRQCKLELHPTKTRIVYCKDSNRRRVRPVTKFDFLGFCFRPRSTRNKRTGCMFVCFMPGVSPSAQKAMRQSIRKSNLRNRTDLGLQDIARFYNPVLRGWLNYYGKINLSAMKPVLRHFNLTLIAWAKHKFRKLKGHKTRAWRFVEKIAKARPELFVHWQRGMPGGFA